MRLNPRDNPMPTFDWTSVKSKVLVSRRLGDLSEFDFQVSDAWQDYIVEHIDRRRGDYLELIIRDDVADYTFKGGRLKNGKVGASVTVPSTWFTGASALENRPVHRDLKQRFFSALAQVCGWPPPSPPPPMRAFPAERFLYRGYHGTFWDARRQGFRRPEFQAAKWFQTDPLWQDNPDPDVCMVEAIRDTYVWGMKKFGSPEPPPLPSRPVPE
ncbi:hypothetical protein NOCA240030 [metagenome]|uniref:Uncharacterized protein n=1 Tax=metagenome TaxID=256318 RepID=A0A2P2C5I9_9ZZZZ